MISRLASLLDRIQPERHTATLTYRRAFLRAERLEPGQAGRVLLDTNVYILAGKGKTPAAVDAILARSDLYHSSVCAMELSMPTGSLDPTHPNSAANIAAVRHIVAMMAPQRLLTPGADAFLAAGILAGTLNRTQGLGPGPIACERCGHANHSRELGRETLRRLINDALIYLTALDNDCALLTNNGDDFDLLHQLLPGVTVIVFDRLP